MERSKSLLIMKLERMTMATFTKLLAISMVAKRRFGLSSRLIISLLFLDLVPRSKFICEGPNEKKAISEPEIRAEQAMSTSMARNPMITGMSTGCRNNLSATIPASA